MIALGGIRSAGMWLRLRKFFTILLLWAAAAFAVYICYRWIDPLPPRQMSIAAGAAGSIYDDFARQYARILARNGVRLNVRNTGGALDNLRLLRDPASGVQAALATFGVAEPDDPETLSSLGGIFDGPIFVFYKNSRPITQFSEFRGKRVAIGLPRTAVRLLMTSVLKASDALDASTQLLDLDSSEAVDALIAGNIDAAIFTSELDGDPLRRAFDSPDIRLMNVTQAEAIAKTIPGLQHVILWRGLISLPHDIPSSDIDLLAVRNRLLVRNDLHPALQYLLLEAMRDVHSPQGPFSRIGEFPAEQPNDLPLSPTAEAFYHSGSTFWQRYTSFWLASLLSRILFFIIPVIALLIPLISIALRFYRWLNTRRIDRFHRALGSLEREIAQASDKSKLRSYGARIAEIESAVQELKVARPFEVDLQRLRIHLRMVEEDISRLEATN
jgi:TRAP-type uncharacterized transport system substrate-binding protein